MKLCATSDTINCWEDINFISAEKSVKKLQKRIAEAYSNGDYDKVTFLQHKLIHSFYAKALAVKVVKSNRGKNTPGVDNIIWSSTNSFKAIMELSRRGYKPLPLRRIYIPKSDGRLRPLSIPTMKDRAMQTLYKFALEPIAEVTADRSSFGFRQNLSAKDAINYCCDVLSNPPYPKWVLKADIKSCFDTISHEWILKHIPVDTTVLSKFLKCGYVEKSVYYPTEAGVPQGSPISSVICNMALDGLEKILNEKCGDDVRMIRYADDIVVIGTSKSVLVQSVVPVINQFLSERGLRLSQEKTNVTNINSDVTFLGWKLYKEKHQIISVPSAKSVNSLLAKVEETLRINQCLTNNDLCRLLGKIVRGWLNYYNAAIPLSSLHGAEFDVISCISNTTENKPIVEFIWKLFSKYDNL